jgi:L-asparaginase
MPREPHLLVLATGGTIAGEAGSATRRDYRSGQVGIADLLGRVEALGLGTRLIGMQVANIGSEDMDWAVLARLHAEASRALADPACDGVIITHGTDTAEETAFLLDLTLPTAKPVVLAGAMHPVDAVGSEAFRNFANAVRVAGDGTAGGRGVLLVMGDDVFAARDARKARTAGANAFAGFPRGPIASATPASVEWYAGPWRPSESARFAWPEAPPRVPILHAFQGMDAGCVEQALAGGARGIVVAGFGHGNMPAVVRTALTGAMRTGVPVVRSTRVDEGLVDREPGDDEAGFIAARALGPAKARVLLQLLVAAGVTDPLACQAAFDRR